MQEETSSGPRLEGLEDWKVADITLALGKRRGLNARDRAQTFW